MSQNNRSRIKNEDQYEALRDQGYSKEKSARIANSDKSASEKGGKSKSYDEWTFDELKDRASELEIEGRSKMNKDDLIKALRD